MGDKESQDSSTSLAIKFVKSMSFQHNEENHRQVKNIFLDVLSIQNEMIAGNGQN